MSHYLYALQAAVEAPPFSLYLKLGHTNDPAKRMVSHKISSPIPLRYVGLWRFKNRSTAIEIEGALHREYLKRWVHGEWHNVTMDEVKEFVGGYFAGRCLFSFSPGTHLPPVPRYPSMREIAIRFRQRQEALENAA